jgi:hypothetical protein
VRLVACVALAAALAGCGKRGNQATAQCAEAAQKGVDAMVALTKERLAKAQLPPEVRAKMEERTKKLEELAPRLRAVITNRCVDDKWPAEVIECTGKVTTMDDVRTCRAKLTPEQQAKVQKEEMDLYAGAMGPPGFGSASPPAATPDMQKLLAELRELNKQLADAVKRDDKAAITDLQTKMTEINAKLAQLRSQAGASAANDIGALVMRLQALDGQITAAAAAVSDAKDEADQKVAKVALQKLQEERDQVKAKLDALRAAPQPQPGPTP